MLILLCTNVLLIYDQIKAMRMKCRPANHFHILCFFANLTCSDFICSLQHRWINSRILWIIYQLSSYQYNASCVTSSIWKAHQTCLEHVSPEYEEVVTLLKRLWWINLCEPLTPIRPLWPRSTSTSSCSFFWRSWWPALLFYLPALQRLAAAKKRCVVCL